MHVCMGWKKRFVSLFLFIILILLTAKDIVANMMNLAPTSSSIKSGSSSPPADPAMYFYQNAAVLPEDWPSVRPAMRYWWVYKKTDTYPKPADTTQLDASWELANKSAWISAPEFQKYWSNQVYFKAYTGQEILNNPSIVYNERFYVGDAVQIVTKGLLGGIGNARHSYIISGTNANGPYGASYLVNSHTDERDGSDLLSIIKTGSLSNKPLTDYYFLFYCVL